MTLARLIPLALRSGLMVAAGTGLILAPFVLHLSDAALVSSVAVGALVVALGLAGTDTAGRGTLPARSQAAYDRGLALGLLLAALAFGAAGDPRAFAVFATAGLTALAVTLFTRYSVARR